MRFASPASTSLDELVQLRSEALAIARLARRRSAAPRYGESMSRRLGRGLDFAELREYQAGDDVRQIDWKVTARTGKPYTKLFVEERERPVYLVIDFRAAMRFGTQGSYKSVLASRLAAILGWYAVAQQDRVGGVVFTDDWHAEIRPQNGRRGLMRVFQSIMHGQNRIPQDSGVTLADTLERVAVVAHGGSAVRIFSDFSGLDRRCASALGGPLAKHDVVGVHVIDPIDEALPDVRLKLVSGVRAAGLSNARRLVVGSVREREAHAERHSNHLARLNTVFSRGRHRCVTISTSGDLLDNARAALDMAIPEKRLTDGRMPQGVLP